MRKYLHKFESLAEFEAAYNGSDYHEPWVSLTKSDVPSKIKISIDSSSGNPELRLTYINKEEVNYGSGGTLEAYIWKVESSTLAEVAVGEYVAVRTIEEREYMGQYIEVVQKEYGMWQPMNSYPMTRLTIIKGPKDKIDYNKHPFTGDLIVEWVNKNGWETWDITYANSDYFGELTCDGPCNSTAQYTCSGPISEGTGKEPLSVRVINANEEQKDYIFEQTDNRFPESNYMKWECNDISCPVYITYADYSGGSPIVLKANDTQS